MSISRSSKSGISLATSPSSSRSVSRTSGLPGPVVSYTATATGNTSASLSWIAPLFSGDTAITSYVISGGGTAVVTGTTANITGLSANTSYDFVVTAVNSIGSGVFHRASPCLTLNFNDATGGTITTASNYNGTGQTWRVHRFNSSGTFTVVNAGLPFSTLVTAGGGSGGYSWHYGWTGGSGGGGQTLLNTDFAMAPGAYAVTRGGSNGNSSISSITAIKGGAGGAAGNGWHGAAGSPNYGAVSSSITGASVSYRGNPGAPGAPNGGGGGAGGAGVVIIAYRII